MYRLMIVDDEKLEREVVGMFVRSGDLDIEEIYECGSGDEALRMILMNDIHIVLMDINMPGMNGLEVMEHLKNAGVSPKIIFSTAYGYFEYAQKALKLGAFDYLLKPVKEEMLIAAVNKAIDALDMEKENSLKEEKLSEFITCIGSHIMKSMVMGDISEEVLYYLEVLGVTEQTAGKCIYVRFDDTESGRDYSRIMKEIEASLAVYGCRFICQIRHEAVTGVIFFRDMTAADTLSEPILKVISHKFETLGQRYVLGYGQTFHDIEDVEKSFVSARIQVGDMTAQPESDRGSAGHDMDETISDIVDYIEKNFEKKLTLDDVAEAVGYSKYHINRVFKLRMGTTIIDYLIRVRIDKAKLLLSNHDLSIRKISELVGYTDSNYFTWSFKKMEGTTPAKYRYENKNAIAGLS